MKDVLSLVTFALIASLLAGCSNKRAGPEIVNVEGTVTVDGEPMGNLWVEFWPQETGEDTAGRVGHNSGAVTDDNGHFVLEAADASGLKGAVVGTHRIEIRDLATVPKFMGRASENHSFGIKPRISVRYSNPITSELIETVEGPRTDIAFDIESWDPDESARLAEEQRLADAAAGAEEPDGAEEGADE